MKKNNPRGINAADLREKSVGFVDGFFSDEFCLARQEGITVRIMPFGKCINIMQRGGTRQFDNVPTVQCIWELKRFGETHHSPSML